MAEYQRKEQLTRQVTMIRMIKT